jgi:drug/metabolite transporter (DMT)-like permease
MEPEERMKKRGFIWISLYFAANLMLTIHNKWVMSKTGFDFPWILTAIHITMSGIGSYILDSIYLGKRKSGTFGLKEETRALLAFSFLYALNIAISNLSLSFVSLALHQVIRSSTPLFTVIFDFFMRKQKIKRVEIISLAPVVLGVVLATIKQGNSPELKFDIEYLLALSLTTFGVALSAMKGIATNAMLNEYNPLELIWKTAIFSSVQCVAFGYLAGEIKGIGIMADSLHDRWPLAREVLLNGFFAFLLNWVSFTANAKTSALTMTVAGNVKQALLIILAIYIFSIKVSFLNIIGIVITLLGGLWYSLLKYNEKRTKGGYQPV